MLFHDSSPKGDATVIEDAPFSSAPNARFGRYEVLRRPDGALHELGRGAMGVTYKASDTKLRRTVALKVINAALLGGDPHARQRFLREASAAAQLHHPHIATVFDIGEEGGDDFYVMEFIEGEDLLSRCRRGGRLDTASGLRIAHQVAQALGAAWQQRVVHRDIKPANLMLAGRSAASSGETKLVVKVVDFGLAKALDAGVEGSSALISRTASFMGTAAYASPEQIEGGELDVRSDLYSLGVTLWHLLVGQPTFGNTSMQQAITGHLAKRPPFSDVRAVGAPEPVIALLGRLLEKNPEDRPASPEALLEEIEQIERQPGGERASALASSATSKSFGPSNSIASLDVSAALAQPEEEAAVTLALGAVPAASFPLVEVLRQRGALRAGEISRMVGAFAAMVNTSRRVGRKSLWGLGLESAHVQFATPPPDLAKLPATSVEAWPPFTVCLHSSQGAADTINVGQTFLPAAREADSSGLQGQLAALIYELLSGTAPRLSYSPLAALNEDANAVLRHALKPPGFGSAEEFIQAFQAALNGNGQPLRVEAGAMKSYPAPTWTPPPVLAATAPDMDERPSLVLSLLGKLMLSLIVSLALAKGLIWWKTPRRPQAPTAAAARAALPARAAVPKLAQAPIPTRAPTPVPTIAPTPIPYPPPPSQFAQPNYPPPNYPPPNFSPSNYPYPPPPPPYFRPLPRR